MCLAKQLGVPEFKEGRGFKVFIKDRGELYSGCYHTGSPRPTNIWLKAEKDSYRLADRLTEDGFHLFHYAEDALAYRDYLRRIARTDGESKWLKAIVREVRYRGAFLQGEGDGEQSKGGWHRTVSVIVADEIFITEEDFE